MHLLLNKLRNGSNTQLKPRLPASSKSAVKTLGRNSSPKMSPKAKKSTEKQGEVLSKETFLSCTETDLKVSDEEPGLVAVENDVPKGKIN